MHKKQIRREVELVKRPHNVDSRGVCVQIKADMHRC